jgi:5-methylthioadenosine/S-adenosylhomocysteine deaminase
LTVPWFVTRMVARSLNLYLDRLYSAFEMISSGITVGSRA